MYCKDIVFKCFNEVSVYICWDWLWSLPDKVEFVKGVTT